MRSSELDYVQYATEGHVITGWTPCPNGEGIDRAEALIEHVRQTQNIPIAARVVRDALKEGGPEAQQFLARLMSGLI